MNDGKLCGLVVLICVICPILVGYAWPVGTMDGIAYETGDPSDITQDSYNAKLPVFVPYNDPYNNNQNVFYDYLFNNFPEVTTGNQGPVWTTYSPDLHYDAVRTDNSGFYEISDVGTWKNWQSGVVAVVFPLWDWNEIDMDDSGNVAELVVYYPQTDKMFFRHLNTAEFQPVESHRLWFSGSVNTNYNLYYLEYYNEGVYAELSYGMQVPEDESSWFNGYLNKGANIIFSTELDNQSIRVKVIDHLEVNDTSIYIRTVNGRIMMHLVQNGTTYYNQDLGENSVYDKVLLTIDYDSGTIALSGLRGMTSYIGDYNAAIRQTITADWRNPVIFRSFSIYSSSDTTWYVADTLAGIAETDGSKNYQIDLRQYAASGSCQLNIRGVLQHSDRITFIINGQSFNGSIDKGILTVTGTNGTITEPINNLLVGLIGNAFYINGQVLTSEASITQARIFFVGDWKMSLYYYPVTETTVKEFSWLPGGFGLDAMGFCSVGLITSVGSALGLGLYGRRSGIRVGLVTLTAMFCAGAYLIFMMNGGL